MSKIIGVIFGKARDCLHTAELNKSLLSVDHSFFFTILTDPWQ